MLDKVMTIRPKLLLYVQCGRQHLDPSSLQLLPDPVRGVEADGLEAQHDGDPLVVGMVDLLVTRTLSSCKNTQHDNRAKAGQGLPELASLQ